MHRPMRIVLFFALSSMLLTACGNGILKKRDDTFKQYEVMIRWSQWNAALDFLAPEYLEENPIRQLDMNRLELFRVTSYVKRQVIVAEDGLSAQQVVEIRLYNRRRAIEQSIVDRQDWRYDEESERWRLHSGLPDVTQRL